MVGHRVIHTARCQLGLSVLLLCSASCGQTYMVAASGTMRSQMVDGDYTGALQTLRDSKHQGYREQDRVVYWMNEGMLLHLTGQLEESNKVFSKAERRAEELFTRSIGKEVKAAFTSQAAVDYPGEDYEKVLLNVFKALNYLMLGIPQEAAVEARKINERLKYYNSKYEHKNVFNQDAFGHWLMGLLFEIEGSYDDARIAYEHSLDVYRSDFAENYGIEPPSFLGEDLVRVAVLAGDTSLAEDYRKKWGASGDTAELLKAKGEVIVVHLNGEGPSKSDFFVTCWFRSAVQWFCDAEPGGEFFKRTTIVVPADGTVIKVAFPELHIHEPEIPYLSLEVNGVTSQSEPVYPLSQIAAKAMADKMHRIYRNAITRAIAKTLSQTAAGAVGKKVGGRGLGWLAKTVTSTAMQANEEADKRAWTTLPARIDIARIFVAPGKHTLRIRLADGSEETIPNVDVRAGKRVVVTYRTLP